MTKIRTLALALAASTILVPIAPAWAQVRDAKPAPIADLVGAVDIPHQAFTLDNGLRVVVHTDRKAPVVAVSVWYRVGSKHEPKGKTGFAHLFEHLMFNGSENAPGDFFEPLQQVGATDFNGTTSVDRTNYFQTVPTGALDLALFLESDRMGHLLGAVTQATLDNQRGVVQNEKRQGDNNPYGLLRYEIFENLFPKGHPYHHSVIGSMDDLNASTLDDVRGWFHDKYGPNNAVLVLAGDIDLATAKDRVNHWFGHIKRGPDIAAPPTSVPTLPAPLAKQVFDKIPATRLYRMWATPGLNDPDAIRLQAAASILGGLSSSRLDNALVRQEGVALSVSAFSQAFEDAGIFLVSADVKPGQDVAAVGARLDAEIASFLADGPTADEIQRASAQTLAGTIGGLEQVGGFGGKAVKLAEGALYSNDPGFYKTELARVAENTPASVQAAARKWLERPVFSLTYSPGERTEGGENRGGAAIPDGGAAAGGADGIGPVAPANYLAADAAADATRPGPAAASAGPDRSSFPAVGELKGLDFPDIQRAKLKNGMEVVFARRAAVPVVNVAVSFDVGHAADPKNALGTQSLMLRLMEEGTTTRSAVQFAEATERLGASISGTATSDQTVFSLTALKPNLAASLGLLADYVQRPALADADLGRVRAQQLNRIRGELNNPSAIATRTLMPIIYGEGHPYGIPPSGLGDAAVVEAATRDQLAAFHQSWIRPDKARIFVVGDTDLRTLTRQLDASFGAWRAPKTPAPVKNFAAAIPAPKSRILLIDRPKAPQSVVVAAKVLDVKGTDKLEVLRAANEVYGGSFLSRINMNLREGKGWSYGVNSRISGTNDRVAFVISAPVQSEHTAESISELRREMTEFLGDKGVTDAERVRTVNGNVRALPGRFETSGAVLNGLQTLSRLGRADDYFETLPAIYAAMTPAAMDTAARAAFDPGNLVYVVVADAETVKPQLDALGLPVEVVSAAAPAAAR